MMALATVTLGMGTFAQPAIAAEAETSCIQGCMDEFPGGDPITIAARGWCYILRGCAFD